MDGACTGSASAEDPRRAHLEWLPSGDLQANWSLRIDTLTAVMLVVVNTVSALVHIYSIGYMSHDDQPRFFAYLSLFTFAMLMLVTADNLLQLFFGWEGVGLPRYLLIGFWYHKPSANAAAIKAFIVNRVGDFGFALGIFAVFGVRHVSFDTIFASAPDQVGKTMEFLGYQIDTLTLICLFCSSARWANRRSSCCTPGCPTPWKDRRRSPRSSTPRPWSRPACSWWRACRRCSSCAAARAAWSGIGAITAFFAATVGVAQNDIKRVVAYSTCSQLGYMFVAMGVGAYSAGMFHLFTHAFFKALLFLGAGSVIHRLHDEQDLRKMGGCARASRSPMHDGDRHAGADRLSADSRLFLQGHDHRSGASRHTEVADYAFILLVIAAFLTSFYSWRLIFMAFFGTPRHDEDHYKRRMNRRW